MKILIRHLIPMRLLLLLVFASSFLYPSESEDRPLGGVAASLAAPLTIASVTLSGNTFPGGSPDGTPVGTINVLMNPPSSTFTGTLALSGTDAARFRIATTGGGGAQQVIYLLPGATQWTVPPDWSSTNSIETIGGGGGGSTPISGSDGAAGGGGGYAKVSNLAGLSGTIPLQVGAKGGPNAAGGDTWFNGASLAASSVGAKGGKQATITTGGLGGGQPGNTGNVGSTITKGGNGGTSLNINNSGPGGGGAAGPTGDGAAGGIGGGQTLVGGGGGGADGGSAGQDDGAGGAGGAGANGGGAGGAGGVANSTDPGIPAQTGGAGHEFDATHGAGGGGGGSGYYPAGTLAGMGGQYGGGGGGANYDNGSGIAIPGSGGDGLIVITYTPAAAGGPPALVLNGSQPGGTYNVTITASQPGLAAFPAPQVITGSVTAQSISAVNLSNQSFAGGAGDGTVVGIVSVVMAPATPPFSGTLSLTGTDATRFRLSSTTVPSNLLLNGTQASGNYSINVVATQPGATGSPFPAAKTITGTTIVTGLLTTFTLQNDSGATLPAGSLITMGQAFRYGDVMPGTYPVIRDAATHVALAGQQWNEISTWRENGSNGSWRHAVWGAWLPNSLAAGATYQVEFIVVAGTYSETSHQALSSLCSGTGAHDFKIHLSDVRNQDDTVRGSGDATFRVCDNITNTGRDAPRHLRAGPVYDEYQVRGMFVYSGSGQADPLLYVSCDLDLVTDAADGTSLKDVRHVCTTHNSWQNVSAGSTGNAGNPGPPGFANDPQAISYQPQILDGSANILNWTGLSQTVNSSASPINASGCPDNTQGAISLTVPGSTGTNVWYAGMPVRVSTTGTPVGGLSNGKIYWVYNCGTTGNRGPTGTDIVALMNTPMPDVTGSPALISSQGSGSTTFTHLFWHPKWEAWYDLDTTADQNWATRGSTARTTRRIYPAFTNTEKTYWEQTGVVLPIYLGQPAPNVLIPYNQSLYPLYEPFAKGIIEGTGATGGRPDLGAVNEYSAQAWLTGTQTDYFYSRLYTSGGTVHGPSVILSEATGRIPPVNNGPPTGPGGNGVGGSYGSGTNSAVPMGAPFRNLTWHRSSPPQGFAQPREDVPNSLTSWESGIVFGTYISHIPNFTSNNYWIFGERIYLDEQYYDANRDMIQNEIGTGPTWRDDIQDGFHFWGLMLNCCQVRGSAWSLRDITFAAASGGDGNMERQYFGDVIAENLTYYPHFLNWANGPTNTNITTAMLPPDDLGYWVATDTFIGAYLFTAIFDMQVMLHAPVLENWIKPFQRLYEGMCGEQATNHLSAFYCIDYSYSPALHDGDFLGHDTAGMGVAFNGNGTDASEFGNFAPYTIILAGGQLVQTFPVYTLTAGDKVKNVNIFFWNSTGTKIDELVGNQWYDIIGPIDNSALTYYIKCPVGHAVTATCPTPGAAFTGFTRNGTPISTPDGVNSAIIYRMTGFNPSTGYVYPGYTSNGGNVIHGLKILGQNVTNALSIFIAREGETYYNQGKPSEWWDTSIVIPGTP